MDINSPQDESQEHFVDIQISSNDENNDDDPMFDFEQDLYEQALVLTELENDPWKEFNAEDISVLQEINYEETGGEFIKEIPSVKAKPITSCVIIDNDHKEIRRCNETSTKSVRELIGVWEIDMDAVNEVDMCGKSPFVEQWMEKLTQIFNQLMAFYPTNFTMDDINDALQEAVDEKCKISQPNIVILEAGPAPNSNLAVHKTCEMYVEDLDLNEGDSLDIYISLTLLELRRISPNSLDVAF
ncbi:12555_t:CDS:2 [Dentiscutata heterogama]|uniref:12555_t:CDS:1 n=1 Tax=Dentiscutata heterogama TaxID=1316150 RepID=A0ACA9K5F0_9GLOM|nr:12555_t:CDS:2 [Dentiscutata heterogama]